MRRSIYYTLLILFLNGLVLVGCQEKTIEDEKKECLEKNGKFTIETKLNFRTGQIEEKGNCK